MVRSKLRGVAKLSGRLSLAALPCLTFFNIAYFSHSYSHFFPFPLRPFSSDSGARVLLRRRQVSLLLILLAAYLIRLLPLRDGLQVGELLLEALGLLGQLLLPGGGGGPLGLVVPGPARKKNRLDVVC